MVLSLAGAAFTEWAGVHAIFGAFMAGVALGDSHHLRQHTRTVLDDFISFFFAPLFFASIGLKVDFLAAVPAVERDATARHPDSMACTMPSSAEVKASSP